MKSSTFGLGASELSKNFSIASHRFIPVIILVNKNILKKVMIAPVPTVYITKIGYALCHVMQSKDACRFSPVSHT